MTLIVVALVMMTLVVLLCLLLIWKTTSSSRQMMLTTLEQNTSLHSQSQQEISRVAQSALSATTEATTRLADGQLKWVETMWLGRDEAPQNSNGTKPEE